MKACFTVQVLERENAPSAITVQVHSTKVVTCTVRARQLTLNCLRRENASCYYSSSTCASTGTTCTCKNLGHTVRDQIFGLRVSIKMYRPCPVANTSREPAKPRDSQNSRSWQLQKQDTIVDKTQLN